MKYTSEAICAAKKCFYTTGRHASVRGKFFAGNRLVVCNIQAPGPVPRVYLKHGIFVIIEIMDLNPLDSNFIENCLLFIKNPFTSEHTIRTQHHTDWAERPDFYCIKILLMVYFILVSCD